jgi:protocatechuate 3,4-dioxygenase beta subunit
MDSNDREYEMNRRNLLKAVGAIGVGAILPAGNLRAGEEGTRDAVLHEGVDCVLIPQETEGPYSLDLSGNASIFRQDVTEGRPGVPLDFTLTVVSVNGGCAPIPNARIDIWHCDKDGVYSGYAQPGVNTVGQTFMRGIQMTDANGQATFHTVYPGWYSGRITHIHFQVFINSVLKATSQIAFPDSLNSEVYKTPLYAGRGQNTSVASNAADMVFSSPAGSLQYELMTLTPNSETGGYNGTFTIGINAPASGIVTLEPETGGQFLLGQNSPNPFTARTSVLFSLVESSQVELMLYDMAGREVTSLFSGRLERGENRVDWDRTASGVSVPSGNYVFQLTVENSMGRFKQAKVMTVK